MKRKNIIKGIAVAAVAGVLAFALAGCGSQSSQASSSATGSASSDSKVIKVGASPSPHAEILNAAKAQLESEGYELQVVEFSDYIQPNVALQQGELDANYFQHQPYLDNYNSQNGTDLDGVAAIHFEPMGIYAGKSSDLTSIPDGAKIAVPSDATNEARALLLLQDQGVITLKDGAGLEATKNDIASNPHNIQLVEVEAASVPRQLQDTDFAVINGNYALSAGLDTTKVLASESADSLAAKTYANVIAVQTKDADSEKTKALVSALESDTVRDFITSTYNGTVVPVF